MSTESQATWQEICDTLGILELHHLTPLPLELHIHRTPGMHACWVSDKGRYCWWVPVGQA